MTGVKNPYRLNAREFRDVEMLNWHRMCTAGMGIFAALGIAIGSIDLLIDAFSGARHLKDEALFVIICVCVCPISYWVWRVCSKSIGNIRSEAARRIGVAGQTN